MPKIRDGAGQSRAQRIRSNAIAGASTLALTIVLARHPVLAADLVLPRPPVFTSGSPWEGFYAGGNVIPVLGKLVLRQRSFGRALDRPNKRGRRGTH